MESLNLLFVIADGSTNKLICESSRTGALLAIIFREW